MDELDKLKDAWKAQDYSKDKVSTSDIYKMLHAKSSSYVKWIFYISVIEFLLSIVLNLFVDSDKYISVYSEMGMKTMLQIMTVISFVIMVVFMYLFYMNYKKICVDCDAKTLMDRILKTRKTVKRYIYFNIGFMMISMFVMFYGIFSSPENTIIYKKISDIPEDFSTNVFIISIVIVMVIMVGVLLLFYRLIYGILLRRLKKNYKELAQLDN